MPVSANPEYLLPWFSADERTRGAQFEDLMRWWLVTSHTLATSTGRLVKVVRWADWSECPGIDLGIDLVGWDEKGRLWAIQCKAYAPERLINKSEVSQLVGAAKTGRGGKFFRRIFITTSDGYTTNAKTIAKSNDVLLLVRNDLDLSAVSLPWPKSEKELRSWLAGKAPKRKTVKPKPHQRKAVEKAVAHLASSARGQLVMACGTGKTLTALWIKERLAAELPKKRRAARVVVLVPSISLLAQTLQAWAANRNSEWKRLAVCSDATAGSARDENFEDMQAVDAGFEVTTDRRAIREFLRNTPGEQVIFSTYQSSAEVAAAARAEKLEFDLVICDEAHRLTGQAGKSYASILDEKAFPARRRLFMTATPKVFTSSAKKKAGDEGYAVASMDDPEKFGGVAYELPFGEAIKKGLLTDYQVVIAVTTDTRAKELLEENRFVGLDGRTMTATDLAAAIAVAKAAKRHKITRAISFHSTIKRSMQFVDTLEQICVVKLPGAPRMLEAGHVDGSVSAKERQRRLDRLKAGAVGFNLLANARCLTEGVDVPSLDGVAFVDPRQSEVDIVQAVGRAIRLSKEKELGTIIVPVVCSAEEAAEGKLDAAGYKKLRQVLWALRAHDVSLAIEVDDFVFAQALSTGKSRTSGIPEKVRIEFDGDELKGFAAKIRTSILKIGSPDAEWAERYAETIAFHRNHERWPSTLGGSPTERFLGRWVGTQRYQYLQNVLSESRAGRLQETPGWEWNPITIKWTRQYDSAVAFHKKHGRWPTTTQRNNAERELGLWVSGQRTHGKKLKAGKRSDMSQERYDLLDATPGWEWDPAEAEWTRQYEAVVAFHKKHGRWPRSNATSPSEVRLRHWLSHQRRLHARNQLESSRIQRMEFYAGLLTEKTDPWRERYDQVALFYQRESRWPGTSVNTNRAERELGLWVSGQRTHGKKLKAGKRSDMSQERYDLLDATPGWEWDPAEAEWTRQYEAVVAFHKKHGRWPSKRATNSEEADLGRWVSSQRSSGNRVHDDNAKYYQLRADRYDLLDATPGWEWDSAEAEWTRQYEAAVAFYAKHRYWNAPRGRSDTAHSAEDRYTLQWLTVQRKEGKRFREGRRSDLSQERYDLLDATPGWEWDPAEAEWTRQYEAVVAFHKKHGRWPSKRSADSRESSLGRWVSTQKVRLGRPSARSVRTPVDARRSLLDTTAGWVWSARS